MNLENTRQLGGLPSAGVLSCDSQTSASRLEIAFLGTKVPKTKPHVAEVHHGVLSMHLSTTQGR